ncbi:MAG: folylpolyglutamate synthase/dihydrofolate synthase family protein [Acidimicrobiia bacterium]
MRSDIREWLDAHINMELGSVGVVAGRDRIGAPTLDRMLALSAYLGSPELDLDGIHITGTNGKTSVARMVTSLLIASGRSVGTYSSPHLERVNERIAINGEPISDRDLDEELAAVRLAEDAAFAGTGTQPSYFEILTAAGFRHFNDEAVEAAVIEVGMGGTWDATNVMSGLVAVVTNVEIDHVAYLGTTREAIAREKAGIIDEGAVLVLGETDVDLQPIFAATPAGFTLRADVDFSVRSAQLAHGGRLLTLESSGRVVDDVFLQLHGAHQARNAAIALAAADAFVGDPLHEDVVREAFATVTSPGRLEVMSREPLVLLDGAHNVAGMEALRRALDEEFGHAERTLVVGFLQEKDPEEMLRALGLSDCRHVICVRPPSPRALDPKEVANAATRIRGPLLRVEVAEDMATALSLAEGVTLDDGQIVVCGSLYVVGAARSILRRG